MKDQYYTAAEAAKALGLEYHTFMARVRRGVYTCSNFGRAKVFDKDYINNTVKAGGHAANTSAMEETTGKPLLHLDKVGDR